LRLIFDIETNGLLDATNTIHSLCIKDIDSGNVWSCTDHDDGYYSITYGLDLLAEAELIVGHNIISFDIPAIQKVAPSWKPKGLIRDTLVMSRLVWPKDDLRDKDFRLKEKGKLPGQLIGRYSLEAWGYRLGEYKGDFKGPWERWTREMQDYCEQDIEVTHRLWNAIAKKEWSEDSFELEHEVQKIIFRQERFGFLFNTEKARSLYGDLVQRKTELEFKLQEAFPPWDVETVFIPKVNNKTRGYVKGEPFIKRKSVTFNPSSRDHIAGRLKAKYGWTPQEFTPDGKPKVDEEVLKHLDYPEAKILNEYLMVDKRLGQLASGKEAWLKAVQPDGRIHGTVITNGAVTGRMTHAKPNVAQVPGNRAPYGHRCRELFEVPKGKMLVGADADALELRCLAAYMAKYDEGAYVKTVLEGKKEDGTDMHSVNARALGCDRDTAKVWFYAFIYGAGDFKLGTILGAPKGKEQDTGKRSRARFLKALPALGTVIEKVKKAVKKKGWLKGLDGRQLSVRSEHASFNTLLQSAGAVLMKQALVILDQTLQAKGYVPGKNYEFVANVHDEWQIECDEAIAEEIGKSAVTAIIRAGEHFNFGCPLNGAYAVGRSWAETH